MHSKIVIFAPAAAAIAKRIWGDVGARAGKRARYHLN
jgi:hypothetical protein